MIVSSFCQRLLPIAAAATVAASTPAWAQTPAPAAPAAAPATGGWPALALADVPKTELRSRLDAGGVVTWTDDVPGSSMPRVHAAAELKAPPEKVWAIVGDCANYKNTMPRVADSKLLRKEGDDVFICRVSADMPFPFSDLTSTTRATHTRKDGSYLRSWTFIEGDYKANTGSWALHPREGGRKTLAVYSLHVEPNIPIPSGILSAAQSRTLPTMMNRLRAQTEPR